MTSPSSLGPKIGGTPKNRNRDLDYMEVVERRHEFFKTATGLVRRQSANNFVERDGGERQPLMLDEVSACDLSDERILLLQDLREDVRIEQSEVHRLGQVPSEIGASHNITLDGLNLRVGKSLIDVRQIFERLHRSHFAGRLGSFRLGHADDETLIGLQLDADDILERATLRRVKIRHVYSAICLHSEIIPEFCRHRYL
jgi:hypothetical protein